MGKLFLKINTYTANITLEVAAALRSLPVGEHPKKIFLDVSKGMLDQDFPHIVMEGSELKLPFQACLKIEKFIDQMKLKANNTDQPQEVNLFSFNIYDNCLKRIVSYTAFNRIVLILRAVDVNNEKAKELLMPAVPKAKPDHIWPSLSEAQWIEVEVSLRNLILNDYAIKN